MVHKAQGRRRMVEIWFVLLGLTVALFAVLDGWNIGAGALHLMAGRTAGERREIVAALGPMWSWHEIWLIAFGGTFLLAFPAVMATAFAGFYLALWLVLWSFILRGVSLEFGGHIDDGLWRTWWDFVFAVSSVALAVLFGVALGNVIRGVPLDASGKFSMSLFTHFGVRGRVGILDWYTLSVAAFTTVLLAAHGALYLRLKTTGPVHDRSERLARRLWLLALPLFVAVSAATWIVRPALYAAMLQRPAAWLAIAVAGAGAGVLATGWRASSEGRAFAGSCAVIIGLLGGAAAAVFPVMLHSTFADEYSMTAYTGAPARHGLAIALVWWPIAFALAFAYVLVVMRWFAGKIPSEGDSLSSLP
jgi:cytochrome d ubiquinol oxidase subunit II